MRIICFIEAHQPQVIERILRHCGLWSERSPRAPPQPGLALLPNDRPAQPRLDVANVDPRVKSDEPTDKRRRRVPLNDHAMRRITGHRRVDPFEAAGRQLGQRLVGAHHAQIQVRLDLEIVGNLLEHLKMLARQADDRFKLIGATQALSDHGSQLDGFGTSAENMQDT